MSRLRAPAHFAVLTLLSLPAVTPWLQGDIPRTNDALTHLYRAFELVRLWQDGVYFPHWGPDLAHGYGYPVYNYFPYLSHSLIGLLNVFGLPALSAMRAAFVLAVLASGWAAYLFARDLFGERAGLMAGVAYVYSPYLLYTAHVRGGLPENLVMVFLPLTFWAIRRVARGEPNYIVVAALAFGGSLFSHLGVTAQAAPFVGLYGLFHSFRTETRPSRGAVGLAIRHSALVILSLLLGLALPALHWIPALAELRYVQFDKGFAGAGIAYFLNFQTVGELFALPRLPVDLDLLNPPVAHPLSFVALGLAVVGIWRHLRQVGVGRHLLQPGGRRLPETPHAGRKGQTPTVEIVFWVGVALVSTFLTLGFSKPIWDAIPLLQQTLWPWRYTGLATLALAILAGTPFVMDEATPLPLHRGGTSFATRSGHSSLPHWSRSPRSASGAGLILSSLVIVLGGYPWLFPPREPAPESPRLADLARWEIPPLLVGTTTTGEYTPIWVKQWPDTSKQQAELTAGEVILDKLDLSNVPEGGGFYHTVHNARYDQYLVTVPATATVRLSMFYFPGYTLQIDNQAVPITPTTEGLISFELTQGQHSVILQFETTPARRLGDAVSLMALWWVLVVGVWRLGPPIGRPVGAVAARLRLAARAMWPRTSAPMPRPSSVAEIQSDTSAPAYLWPLFLSGAFVLIVKSALLDTGLTPLVRHGLRDDPPAHPQHSLDLDFGGELQLLGYDLKPVSIGADDTTLLNLYWRAAQPLGVPYGFTVRLEDDAGRIWNAAETVRPRNWRFTPGADFWPPDAYVLDPYLVMPIVGAPPGVYHLRVIVYRAGDRQAIGAEKIGTLTIDSPARLGPAQPLAEFGGIALMQVSLDRTEAAPGDPLGLSLLWTSSRAVDRDLQAEVYLANSRGQTVSRHVAAIAPSYPTSHWKPADGLRDQVVMYLPAWMVSDNYTVQARVFDPSLGLIGEPYTLGRLRVTAPRRVFETPTPDHSVNVELGDAVALLGYDESPAMLKPGDTLTITLYWKARAEMSTSYHVFVHLTDASGAIVAQSDGVPANWTRPTTGWLPGEYVADERTLVLPADLPPGEYTLSAGIYHPETGERLVSLSYSDGIVALGTTVQSTTP